MGSFADRVNIVDTSDATLDLVLAKVSHWPIGEVASRRFEACSEVVSGRNCSGRAFRVLTRSGCPLI